MKNIEEKHWDSFVVLSFMILDEPPCYVRQCLASSTYIYSIGNSARTYIYYIMVCLGISLLHMYVCVFIYKCTAIHNCSSSGSLFFTTLRWNTKNMQ